MADKKRMSSYMTRGVLVRRLAVTLSAGSTVTVMLAGCGSVAESDTDDDTSTVACVDENDNVVDPDRCDGSNSGGFFYFVSFPGSHTYPTGTRLTGGDRVASNDSLGRERIGVAATGRPTVGIVRGGLGTPNGVRGGSSGS